MSISVYLYVDYDTSYIIDTQISTYTNSNYKQKTDYYNTPDIIIYAKQATVCNIIIFSASCWNWRGISSSLSVKNFQTMGLDKSKWWVVEFLLELSKCIEMTAEMHRYQCQCRIIFWWLCYNGAIWSRDHNIDNNS